MGEYETQTTGGSVKIIGIFILGIILFSNTVHAVENINNGNGLLEECHQATRTGDNLSSTEYLLSIFCIGKLQGIAELNAMYQHEYKIKGFFCKSRGQITNTQLARIVVKYLNNHPEQLHLNDTYLTVVALEEAYPCK